MRELVWFGGVAAVRPGLGSMNMATVLCLTVSWWACTSGVDGERGRLDSGEPAPHRPPGLEPTPHHQWSEVRMQPTARNEPGRSVNCVKSPLVPDGGALMAMHPDEDAVGPGAPSP